MAKTDSYIEKYKEEMAESLSEMLKIPAISPKNGGQGEGKRADFLEKLIKKSGFEAKRYDYKDEGSTIRSNLIVKYGSLPKTLWIMPHMDTVAPGDLAKWNGSPFSGNINDGKVYGRGASDNGQDVIASIYALKSLKDSGAKLKYTYAIAIVADEETGSRYGIDKLMDEGIFSKEDPMLIPDAGAEDGSKIIVSQKGQISVKITVKGKEAHASRPMLGLNAALHSMKFLSSLSDNLYKKYNYNDTKFYPQNSTFEVTKRISNVESANIIPGTDISYMDCRIIPKYDVEDISLQILSEARGYEKKVPGLHIDIDFVGKSNPPPEADSNSAIMKLLKDKVKALINEEPKIMGWGGGSIAGRLRRNGYPNAVLWSIKDNIAHSSNEYCTIKHMTDDAKLFASLFL